MNFGDLKQTIEKLELTKGEYAVFGSGTLLALGIVEIIEDIDIVVTINEYNRLLLYHQVLGNGIFIEIGSIKIEIFKDWTGMEVNEIINKAIYIDNIAFAALNHVLEFKYLLKRPKDIEHIIKINKFINSKNEKR